MMYKTLTDKFTNFTNFLNGVLYHFKMDQKTAYFKESNSPKLIYKFNAVPTKITTGS